MDNFLAQISLFGFAYAPRGWAFCNGQLLSIAQNQALFSLLGTTYGGDGINNFRLPDLRGRRVLGYGQGQGLSYYAEGGVGGVESVALTVPQMPAHTHVVKATTAGASDPSPTNNLWAQDSGGTLQNYSTVSADNFMNPAAIANTGGGQGHNNLPPYTVVNYCIALTGIYPPRS